MNHLDLIHTFIDHYYKGKHLELVSIVDQVKPLGLSFSNLFHSIHCNHVFGGFRGKRVLEMGGALPSQYVSQVLEAESWAAVEYKGYTDNQFASVNLTSGTNYIYDNNGWESFYDNWKNTNQEKFDVVYSISAFEHIYDLGGCINAMYDMLKENGQLYSTFTPIWSACNGAHGFFPKFVSPGIAHEHLMYDFISIQNLLINSHGVSPSAAYKHAHELYKSDQINRYTYEEYVNIFNQSKFEVKRVKAIEDKEISSLYSREKVQKIKSFYPNMSKSCSGFSIYFKKLTS